MPQIHLTQRTFIDRLEPSQSTELQTLVFNQLETDQTQFSYKFPLAKEVIMHDLTIQAENIESIALVIGNQMVAFTDSKRQITTKYLKAGSFQADPERPNTYKLTQPNFLVPFAHRYHELDLHITFSRGGSMLTIDRRISLPSPEIIKQLTEQTFHTMTVIDNSWSILKYSNGMVGVMYMPPHTE